MRLGVGDREFQHSYSQRQESSHKSKAENGDYREALGWSECRVLPDPSVLTRPMGGSCMCYWPGFTREPISGVCRLDSDEDRSPHQDSYSVYPQSIWFELFSEKESM